MAGLQMSFTMATDDPQVVLSNFKDKCIRLIDNFADKCCLKDKKVGSLGLTLKHMSKREIALFVSHLNSLPIVTLSMEVHETLSKVAFGTLLIPTLLRLDVTCVNASILHVGLFLVRTAKAGISLQHFGITFKRQAQAGGLLPDDEHLSAWCLFTDLVDHKSLQSVRVSANKLTPSSIHALAQVISSCADLATIDVAVNCGLKGYYTPLWGALKTCAARGVLRTVVLWVPVDEVWLGDALGRCVSLVHLCVNDISVGAHMPLPQHPPPEANDDDARPPPTLLEQLFLPSLRVMSFENRPPRLSAAINFCARTPTLERVTILPFLLPLFADSASLHDDVAGVRAMFDSMPGTTLRSLTATSPTASLFSIAPPPAAAQLAHMHSVLERNARLAARTQAAARRAMLPLIVLLNSRAAPPARCTLPRAAGWNTLPRELQLLVMVHLSGDEGAVSRAQWRRLMSYAGDKEAVLADARAGTEVPHAHPNELGVGIGVGVGGGLKDTAGAREHVLRRLGLWHWEGPPVGDRDEDEDEDEEDRQGEGHTDANGEAEGAETEEEHETLTDDEESAAEVAEAQVAVAEAAAATDAARMDLQTAVEDAAAARATLRQTEAALNVSGAVLGAIQDVLDTVTTALERPLPPQ